MNLFNQLLITTLTLLNLYKLILIILIAHHDALELVSGAIVKVHDLIEGQICNVLQLPVSEQVTDPVVEEAANNYFESLMSA